MCRCAMVGTVPKFSLHGVYTGEVNDATQRVDNLSWTYNNTYLEKDNSVTNSSQIRIINLLKMFTKY